MKNTILVILLIVTSLFSENNTKIGIKFIIGGRFDDLRMCVSSDRGTRGGMIADVMLTVEQELDNNSMISFELPVVRPILFATAFKMLQFEPQFTYTYSKDDYLFSGGAGVSFHYGPDYNSDLKNRGPSFFAMGPLVSASVLTNTDQDDTELYTGLKAFYVRLYSKESELSPGTVLGLASETRYYP